MLDGLDERTPFRTPQRLAHAAHERRWDRRLLAARDPVAGAPGLEFPLQQRDQGLAILDTRFVRGKAAVVRELRPAEDALAELREVPVRAGAASSNSIPVSTCIRKTISSTEPSMLGESCQQRAVRFVGPA